jgi:hypothetical protein
MVSSAYYRRQADVCLQLAMIAADQRVGCWLVELAKKYSAKADRSGAESNAESNEMPSDMIEAGQFSNGGMDRD